MYKATINTGIDKGCVLTTVIFPDAQTAMLELERAAQEARLQWARGFTDNERGANPWKPIGTDSHKPSPQIQQEADDLRERNR